MRQFEASVVAAAVKENLNKYRAANPFLSRIMDTISEVGDIYIVGGYIRNVYFGGRVRDIDMMVDIDGHMLRSIVQNSGCLYTYNRHGGMKLYVDSVVADIWTIDDNWAFKSNSVILRDDSKLNSIAQGCFYNYDSLVYRLVDNRYNFKYFEEFLNTKVLDILKDANYQARNPMLEANILRAFYIKENYDISFSDRVKIYIFEEIVNLDLMGYDVWKRIERFQEKYPKYNKMQIKKVKCEIQELMKEVIKKQPYLFDISHLIN